MSIASLARRLSLAICPSFTSMFSCKGDPIGAATGVALPGDGRSWSVAVSPFSCDATIVAKSFSRKFLPEIVQKILDGAADATVIIGCAKEDDIRAIHSCLE
jgi:hypothetical protein